MKTITIKNKNHKFRVNIDSDGEAIPKAIDLLSYLRIYGLTDKTFADTVDRLHTMYGDTYLFKFVKMVTHTTKKESQLFILRYNLLYFGLILSASKHEMQKQWAFGKLKGLIENSSKLDNDLTPEVIVNMFCNEGFDSKFLENSLEIQITNSN